MLISYSLQVVLGTGQDGHRTYADVVYLVCAAWLMQVEAPVSTEPPERCCICLEAMHAAATKAGAVHMLACTHCLHAGCLLRWAEGKDQLVCPLCKHVSGTGVHCQIADG